MGRFQRSWSLFKSSASVVFQNPKVLLFPIVASAATVAIALFFLAPVALQPTGHGCGELTHWSAVAQLIFTQESLDHMGAGERGALHFRTAAIVYLLVLYFVSMFLAIFSNVAFLSEIMKSLRGRKPSVLRGVRFACARWKPIVMWTLFAGLVGALIRAIEQRLDFVGRWVLRVIGIAWSIASVFAIPVIICADEATNPLSVLKKSALTLKKTWGELVIGYVGLAGINAIIGLISLGWLAAALILALLAKSFWVVGVAFVLWLVFLVGVGYLSSVAGQVYRCALYMYAATGTAPAPYTKDQMEQAWKTRKAKTPNA